MKSIWAIFFWFSFFIFSETSLAQNTQEIFNKLNSAIRLSVTKFDGRTYTCSSVAIAPQVLLTAAHCLKNAQRVLADDPRSQTALVANFFKVHPRYNKSNSNYLFDIGVVVLKQKLRSGINYLPILKNLKGHESLHRIGFGGRENGNQKTLVSPIQNFRQYGSWDHQASFVEMEDHFSYSGDSGGPVYAQVGQSYYLVGVHSTKQGNYSFNPVINQTIYDWLISL